MLYIIFYCTNLSYIYVQKSYAQNNWLLSILNFQQKKKKKKNSYPFYSIKIISKIVNVRILAFSLSLSLQARSARKHPLTFLFWKGKQEQGEQNKGKSLIVRHCLVDPRRRNTSIRLPFPLLRYTFQGWWKAYAVSRMESTDREKERRKYPSCPHPTRYMRMRWNESGRSAALSSIEKIWISFPISDVSWHFAGRRVAGAGVFNETRTIQRNAIRYFVRRIRDPTLLPCVSVRRRGGFLCGYTKLRSIMVGRLVSFKQVWLWLISLNDSLVVTYIITYVCTIWV